MTFGRRRPEPFDSAEGAQLQRDIVASVVHELASITSALSLRVDGTPGPLSENDVQAVAALTTQLRNATKPLIWLRGSPGRGMLAPVRSIDVDTWWRHTSRVAYALLPHGTRITLAATNVAHGPDNVLPGEDLAIFAMLVLGTCRHFVDVDQTLPVALEVTLPRSSDQQQPMVCLQLTPVNELSLEPVIRRTTRWKRFCHRTAARAGATLNWWQPIDWGGTQAWQWSASRNGSVA
jgi:hypothetical protein